MMARLSDYWDSRPEASEYGCMELDHRGAELPFQCLLTFAGQIIETGTTCYRLAHASTAADAYDFCQIAE